MQLSSCDSRRPCREFICYVSNLRAGANVCSPTPTVTFAPAVYVQRGCQALVEKLRMDQRDPLHGMEINVPRNIKNHAVIRGRSNDDAVGAKCLDDVPAPLGPQSPPPFKRRVLI